MKRIALILAVVLLVAVAGWLFSRATPWLGSTARADDTNEEGWISLFDGQHLTDWEANELANNWTVEDGCIVGRGSRSHLFYKGQQFQNFEFKAEVKLN